MPRGTGVGLLGDTWVSDQGTTFIVGGDGLILHHDGVAFTDRSVGQPIRFTQVWGRSNTEVYAAGVENDIATLYSFDGSDWAPVGPIPGISVGVVTLDGDADTLYATGSAGELVKLERITNQWSDLRIDNHESSVGGAVSVFETGVVVLIADQARAHVYEVSSAGATKLVEFPALPSSIYASSATDIHIGDRNGFIWHYDGMELVAFETEGAIAKVEGSGPSDVFAVSPNRLLYHYDGHRWATLNGPRLTYDKLDVAVDRVQFLDFLGATVQLVRTTPW